MAYTAVNEAYNMATKKGEFDEVDAFLIRKTHSVKT